MSLRDDLIAAKALNDKHNCGVGMAISHTAPKTQKGHRERQRAMFEAIKAVRFGPNDIATRESQNALFDRAIEAAL